MTLAHRPEHYSHVLSCVDWPRCRTRFVASYLMHWMSTWDGSCAPRELCWPVWSWCFGKGEEWVVGVFCVWRRDWSCCAVDGSKFSMFLVHCIDVAIENLIQRHATRESLCNAPITPSIPALVVCTFPRFVQLNENSEAIKIRFGYHIINQKFEKTILLHNSP